MPAVPKIPNNLDEMCFDTASITKLFTAVATLQLIDQQRLAFDTRVIDLLGLEDTAISNEVTVYQLLTHTSGIGDDAEEENNERYEDVWKEQTQLLNFHNNRHVTSICPQTGQFSTGAGMSLL